VGAAADLPPGATGKSQDCADDGKHDAQRPQDRDASKEADK
jgi:hypothetical protein